MKWLHTVRESGREKIIDTLANYFLWFSCYSVLGWIYETIFCSINAGRLVERGFFIGPYLPIYGSGAIIIIALVGKEKSVFRIFFRSMVVTTTIEYFTSLILETIFDKKWWDYSDYAINFEGRISLLASLAFGTFALFLVKLIHPYVESKTSRLSLTAKSFILRAGLALFLADFCVSVARWIQ